MPVCVFEATITSPPVYINGVGGGNGRVLAKSGTQNNSTACDFVMLTNAEYDQIYHALLVAKPSPAEEFDYTYGAGVWGLAFTTVVALYLGAHAIGNVLGFIRRG